MIGDPCIPASFGPAIPTFWTPTTSGDGSNFTMDDNGEINPIAVLGNWEEGDEEYTVPDVQCIGTVIPDDTDDGSSPMGCKHNADT